VVAVLVVLAVGAALVGLILARRLVRWRRDRRLSAGERRVAEARAAREALRALRKEADRQQGRRRRRDEGWEGPGTNEGSAGSWGSAMHD